MAVCRIHGHQWPRNSHTIPYCTRHVSSLPNSNHMFMFGVGFVAKSLSLQLKNEGWVVSGTCRGEEKRKELEGIGVQTFVYDLDIGGIESLPNLTDASHLLISIPPITGLGDPLLYYHKDLLRNKLDNGNLKWICYLSSTSVYGDAGGAWVDEDSPAVTSKESSLSRLIAEKNWLDLGHDLGISSFVFRLGGIYGPGRSALDTILEGKSYSGKQKTRESKRYTSRIHVSDICQALKCSMNKPSSGGIYNIVDDEPAPRSEVFAFAKELINQRWPGRIRNEIIPAVTISSESAANNQSSMQCEEKRVMNKRMKEELGVKLIHPTYRLFTKFFLLG